jgi:diguanylate cyclase (GGDEF)-like protein
VVVAAADGVIMYATQSAARVLGTDDPAGARIGALAGDDVLQAVSRVLGSGSGIPVPDPVIWQAPGGNGSAGWFEVRASALRNGHSVHGAVLSFRDVTAQRQREDELRRMAFRDPLTRLPNRALFSEQAVAAVASAERSGELVAVMMCDLDGFKAVNDTHGHPAGDELLIAAARRLASLIRPSDTAARLGGDEFALLLDGIGSPDAARAVAARVVDAIAAPFTLAGGTATVTVGISAGIAVSDGAGIGTSPDVLAARADQALYEAKAAGKNTWREYGSPRPRGPAPPEGESTGPAWGRFSRLIGRAFPFSPGAGRPENTRRPSPRPGRIRNGPPRRR